MDEYPYEDIERDKKQESAEHDEKKERPENEAGHQACDDGTQQFEAGLSAFSLGFNKTPV